MFNLILGIPRFIKKKISCEIKEINNNFNNRLSFQNSLYSKYHLSRGAGLELLNKTLDQENLDKYDENFGMYSEHIIMLAAISCSKNHKINSILEIGTFDGITSVLLSKFFPDAAIITIDLEDDDPIFSKPTLGFFDSSKLSTTDAPMTAN